MPDVQAANRTADGRLIPAPDSAKGAPLPRVDAFQEDRQCVLDDLARGEFDHLEVATPVTEARLFDFLLEPGDP